MMTKTQKVELPQNVKDDMKDWKVRGTVNPIPNSYVRFHTDLAVKASVQLQDSGYTVHRKYMADDGWGDGFSVIHLIVETPRRELLKLRWQDRNQGWMRYVNPGWAIWSPEEDA